MNATDITPLSRRKQWYDASFPLHAAARDGNNERLQRLISGITNHQGLDTADDYGNTALHLAALKGRANCARSLLYAGANVDAGDCNGNTPLHDASESGAREVMQTLIDAGAGVNAKTRRGRTPLHDVAELNVQTAILKILLNAGANLNAIDNYGDTPIIVAVRAKRLCVAKFLQNWQSQQD